MKLLRTRSFANIQFLDSREVPPDSKLRGKLFDVQIQKKEEKEAYK